MNPFRLAIVLSVLALSAGAANAQQGFFPRDWFEGRSGLFHRQYVTPQQDLVQPRLQGGYLTGGARRGKGGRLLFAAATVDSYCQQEQIPQIQVIEAPRSGRIAVDHGAFIATGLDGGSTYCVGRHVRGARVFFTGRAAAGDRVVVRVSYPSFGIDQRGFIQDHVIPVGR